MAPALQLIGHAERLSASGYQAEPIRAIAEQLLFLADDLQDQGCDGLAECLSVEPEQVAVGPLVRAIVASISALLGSRRHWRVAPVLDGLTLQADRRALHQVLTRVLSNAARFSGDDDWIDIEARQIDQTLLISVQDEGHSPAPATGLSTDRRGLGLGLLLSRRLMQVHGGSLAVIGAPGIGTCVTLSFPAHLLLP